MVTLPIITQQYFVFSLRLERGCLGNRDETNIPRRSDGNTGIGQNSLLIPLSSGVTLSLSPPTAHPCSDFLPFSLHIHTPTDHTFCSYEKLGQIIQTPEGFSVLSLQDFTETNGDTIFGSQACISLVLSSLSYWFLCK